MAVVTEHLFQLIAKQVEDRGLVVWYDPEQAFASAAAELAISKTTVARYDGSFFRLRHDDRPPDERRPAAPVGRLRARRAAQHQTTPSSSWKQPGSSCSRPAAAQPQHQVGRRRSQCPPTPPRNDQVAEIEMQVESGKLSLADLNALAEKGNVSSGVLTLIFGSANPQEVALAFLHGDYTTAKLRKSRPRTTCGICSSPASTSKSSRIATLANLRSGWPVMCCSPT